MVLEMRKDIREARKRIWQSVQFLPSDVGADLKETIYNLAVKAYLRGYNEGVKRSEETVTTILNESNFG